MSNTVYLFVFYGAFSLIIIILVYMFFKAMQSIIRIDSTLKEILKTLEQHEKRIEEKEMKRFP